MKRYGAIFEAEINKMSELNPDSLYEVLKWIFDKAGGSQNEIVDLLLLPTENSKYSKNTLEKISDYLEGENLLVRPINEGIEVQITHKGIVEIQKSINSPNTPTEHFPSHVINNFYANVGSNQTGNHNIANVQQNFGPKTEDVMNLLHKLREHLSEDKKQEGSALIESLEKEITAENPSEPTIKLFLKGISEL